jgi:hypothetical protein
MLDHARFNTPTKNLEINIPSCNIDHEAQNHIMLSANVTGELTLKQGLVWTVPDSDRILTSIGTLTFARPHINTCAAIQFVHSNGLKNVGTINMGVEFNEAQYYALNVSDEYGFA